MFNGRVHALQPTRLRWLVVVLVAVVMALVASGCGGDDENGNGGSGEGADSDSVDLELAQEQVERAYQGTYTEPPSESNPPVEGKTVWLLSCGEQIPTCALLTAAMQRAAETLGWETNVFDGEGVPANYTRGIRDAVAAGADGILPISYDCPLVKQALMQAQRAGVESVPVLGWDCDEVEPDGEALYSAQISFGDRFASQEEVYRQSGRDIAAWVISHTEGEASTLAFTSDEFYTLAFQQEAFEENYGELCPGCPIEEFPYQATDYGSPLQQRVASALVQNPDANAMYGVPIPTAGPAPALQESGRIDEISVIGGYGLPEDTDLVLENRGLDAIFALPMEWVSYAAVDSLNRVFADREQVDQGLGYAILDEEAGNVPPAGEPFRTDVDFVAAYEESWGK